MTRYEFLKQNQAVLHKFHQHGIISYMLFRDIDIFESYEALSDIHHMGTKILLLSEEYELSAGRVEQIIYTMQRPLK